MLHTLNNFFQAVIDTSPWIWIAFGFLFLKGIQSLQSTTIAYKKVFIVPCVFLAMSLHGLWPYRHELFPAAAIWLCAFVVGMILGHYIFRGTQMHVHKHEGTITFEKSWLLFVMVLVVLAIRLSFGFFVHEYPESADSLAFIATKMGVTGMLSGTFIGRAIYFVGRYWHD